MATKKTIIVSIITTLATMFIVAVIMHMSCGNCSGNPSCSTAKSHCEQSSSCKSESKCGKEKSCSKKSKCGEEKSCTKSSSDKVVKKVVEVKIDDKK